MQSWTILARQARPRRPNSASMPAGDRIRRNREYRTAAAGELGGCTGVRNSMRGCRRILIVADDSALRRSLAEQLERHCAFAVLPCAHAAAALAAIRHEPL